MMTNHQIYHHQNQIYLSQKFPNQRETQAETRKEILTLHQTFLRMIRMGIRFLANISPKTNILCQMRKKSVPPAVNPNRGGWRIPYLQEKQ
jgi:hypothetical protein